MLGTLGDSVIVATMPRNLLIIVCAPQDTRESITTSLSSLVEEHKVDYKILHISKPPDLEKRVKKLDLSTFDAVAVHGGDGTAIAAIKAFCTYQLPVLILPGGTANILAKYFGMPASVEDSLLLYLKNTYIKEHIDVAKLNKSPFVLDMHFGLWTEAIKDTPKDLKNKLGQSAYAWSALKKARVAEEQTYEYKLDGKDIRTVKGYTLLIANMGYQNVLGMPLFPRTHSPGMVQMAIVKNIKPMSLIQWFLVRRLFGKNLNNVIEIYRGRQIVITKAPRQLLADDDRYELPTPITIKGGEYSAKVIIPPEPLGVSLIHRYKRRVQLFWHLIIQRVNIFIDGRPNINFSHVAPGLYLGGMYRKAAYQLFQEWGITGIVNMRRSASPPAPKSIEILHLATEDWHPPTLEDIGKGVKFIKHHLNKGGAVYVHCKLGEGRGPTMAAAYLITTGLSVEEALKHIKKYRPFIRPNAKQIRLLSQWQDRYTKHIV